MKSCRGRPPIQIDPLQFEKLCGIQCTEEEIAGWFKCSIDTIERWCKREYGDNFAEVYKKYSVDGKISLRRNQFNLAKTSAAMAIWLGKQYLNQRDNNSDVEFEDDNKIHIDVVIKDLSDGGGDE